VSTIPYTFSSLKCLDWHIFINNSYTIGQNLREREDSSRLCVSHSLYACMHMYNILIPLKVLRYVW
jgi:hypothetical protein